MNLSKKLLLALAGTSMMAPMAASAQELASLNGSAAINEYMQQQDVDRFRAWESKNQVTSVSQFSDVQPTDWAYQALANLVERNGCVAGFPDSKFKGGNAMTRYEAAALLNSCLDRVTEKTDELQKLLNEFDGELTVLTGRVDGLESKVGKLRAQQFSTTTRLKGVANFFLGGLDGNPDLTADKTTFNYDYRLTLTTQFGDKSKLVSRLRSANFAKDNQFSGSGSAGNMVGADIAASTADSINLDRLYYQFPLKAIDGLTITAGPLARNTETVAFIPSAYKSGILDYFGLAGATGVYNKATGSLFGFTWKQKVKKGNPYFTVSSNYVTDNKKAAVSSEGLFSGEGNSWLSQLGYVGPNWGIALAANYINEGQKTIRKGSKVSQTTLAAGQDAISYAIGGYWKPLETGIIPSISLGLGGTNVERLSATKGNNDSFGWTAGLQWDNAFVKGNSLGFAFAMPQQGDTEAGVKTEDTFAYELFYRFKVSDNITVTPAVFYIQNSQGATTTAAERDVFGAVVQTTFKF
ncbi:MAG: iron uptake porin [Cyanobacteria bacterium]|nr:iron uptake porin [Cyanobacteriota bacterium]